MKGKERKQTATLKRNDKRKTGPRVESQEESQKLQVINPGCSFHARVAMKSSMFQILRPDALQGKLMTSIKVPRFPVTFPASSFIGQILI